MNRFKAYLHKKNYFKTVKSPNSRNVKNKGFLKSKEFVKGLAVTQDEIVENSYNEEESDNDEYHYLNESIDQSLIFEAERDDFESEHVQIKNEKIISLIKELANLIGVPDKYVSEEHLIMVDKSSGSGFKGNVFLEKLSEYLLRIGNEGDVQAYRQFSKLLSSLEGLVGEKGKYRVFYNTILKITGFMNIGVAVVERNKALRAVKNVKLLKKNSSNVIDDLAKAVAYMTLVVDIARERIDYEADPLDKTEDGKPFSTSDPSFKDKYDPNKGKVSYRVKGKKTSFEYVNPSTGKKEIGSFNINNVSEIRKQLINLIKEVHVVIAAYYGNPKGDTNLVQNALDVFKFLYFDKNEILKGSSLEDYFFNVLQLERRFSHAPRAFLIKCKDRDKTKPCLSILGWHSVNTPYQKNEHVLDIDFILKNAPSYASYGGEDSFIDSVLGRDRASNSGSKRAISESSLSYEEYLQKLRVPSHMKWFEMPLSHYIDLCNDPKFRLSSVLNTFGMIAKYHQSKNDILHDKAVHLTESIRKYFISK